MEDASKILELIGTPLGVVAAVLLTMWRVAKWLAPIAEKLTNRHIEFMDACAKNQSELGQKADVIHASITRTEAKVDAIHNKVTSSRSVDASMRASSAPIAPEPR